MKSHQDTQMIAGANIKRPRGQVLKGQYVDVLRSAKGKLKGIVLRTAEATYTVKLPKYLRPVLIRELAPHAFVQVWAYPDDGHWHGINLMPLEEADAIALRDALSDRDVIEPVEDSPTESSTRSPAPKNTCVQVCRKGKCCKRGSVNLLKTLQAEVESNPELVHVKVEGVGCMSACKKGPNLKISKSKKVITGVTVESALSLIASQSS